MIVRIGVVTLLSACVGVLLVPATTVLVLLTVSRHSLPRVVGTSAITSGFVAVAVVAWAVGAGLLLAVPLLCAGLSSPWLVERIAAYAGGGDPGRAPRRASAADLGRQSLPLVPPVADPSGMPAPVALTDHDLCLAWCASFIALSSATSPTARASVVSLRQTYLDEFERRNPPGLSAWLDSGARPAANPARFVCRREPGQGNAV